MPNPKKKKAQKKVVKKVVKKQLAVQQPYVPSYGRRFLQAAGAIGGGVATGQMLRAFNPAADGVPFHLSTAAGAAAGAHYADKLANIVGFGDYEIKKNVFMQGRLPQFMNIPQGGGTIIRFQEYLGDIVTSSSANTFNLQSFMINAANSDTFPWLSQIAANYEQYSFEGLIFEFRSTSADALNSTNTALGTVIMATNYDAADANFASKSEMLNYEFSTCTKPSESVIHMVECEPNQTVLSDLYTLVTPDPPAGKDSRFYHLGNFQIATSGFQGTDINVGSLFCSYQCRLLKPKLYNSLGYDIEWAHWTNATGVAAGTPLGTPGSEVVLGDTIDIDHSSALDFFLPIQGVSKTYMVWVLYGGTAAAVVAPAVTLTNCVSAGLAGLSQTPPSAVSSANMRFGFTLVTDGNGTIPRVAFGTAGTIPTGSSTLTVYIFQIPNDVA